MKEYTKPEMEITVFRAQENIAAASIFEYTEGGVPVTMFGVQESGWSGGPPSNV